MIEGQPLEGIFLNQKRDSLFQQAERELRHEVSIYRLKDRFEGLPNNLGNITMLDASNIPGCHYGVRNVFVPIIHHLEEVGFSVKDKYVDINPDTTILVEPSTGNSWVAFSDAAEMLGYEHIVVMPEGLPESRYRHPNGRPVKILRTPKEEYAEGMPKQLQSLIMQNRRRIALGQKIYITPNHPISSADITVKAMADLGRQLAAKLQGKAFTFVGSMGNGASICSIGEYLKENTDDARVIATESFNYGGGYDWYANTHRKPSYKKLYGIDPGNPILMKQFDAFGTNAPIGIELPLQKRAIEGGLLDDYSLFTTQATFDVYKSIPGLSQEQINNASSLPNRNKLPQSLYEAYGNSTLANIEVASQYTNEEREIVAIAYDSRKAYS